MSKGYNPENFQAYDPLLEEFIVDYVDETMDVHTRSAFEAYLCDHPELHEQVRRMQEIRSMMCGLNCGCMAPPGFQARLRNKLACEMMREELPTSLSSEHTPAFHLVASVVVVLITFGSFYWILDRFSSKELQTPPPNEVISALQTLPVHAYQAAAVFPSKRAVNQPSKGEVRNSLRKSLPRTAPTWAFSLKKPITCPHL
ncbi:MAG: hypothetical protein JNN12_01025 [Bacteroidetes Order II. Incertae sedis bacterium]|nr:hypothetical protein [Bacteroidetes Order II. bacterium]